MAKRVPERRIRDSGQSPERLGTPAATVDRSFGARFLLTLIAFVSGASIMVVELTGNRVLAPWFGNSLHTWTGLIGVVLVSMSAGYYLGGRAGDRWPSYVAIAHLLAASAVLVALVPLTQQALEASMSTASVVWGPVLASALLFAIPGCLLAAVSPFAVRLTSLLSADQRIGLSAGWISMCSTAGSVAGTFGAGFLLIPNFSVPTIFAAVAATLALLAVALYLQVLRAPRVRAVAAGGVIAATGAVLLAGVAARPALAREILFETQTFYHRIRVYQRPASDGHAMRMLVLDTTTEGVQYVDRPGIPAPAAFNYLRCWRLAKLFVADLRAAAFLGGGAFTMPEALLAELPQARADVVEIDPEVIAAGRRFFRAGLDPRMNLVAADARRFLTATDQSYDLIVGDVFNGIRSVPSHLVTREFLELVRRRLRPNGVYIMNLIGAVEGADNGMFVASVRTLRQVFAGVEVFAMMPDRLDRSQNVVLVARTAPIGDLLALPASNDPEMRPLLACRLPVERYHVPDDFILTDAFNPIEYIVAQFMKSN